MCGFASASHFSRAYRAAYGHPPKVERQKRDWTAA
jgi:transcriptional regulator GlxA family with amidase domain